MSYELASFLTSVFESSGEIRVATSKSSLKRQLPVQVSLRISTTGIVDFVIDGSALLWMVPWTADGTVVDFTDNMKQILAKKLILGDIHLVFDRYYEYSTKGETRSARVNGASRVHQLLLHNKLPSQKTVLAVSENKKQLIRHIIKLLSEDKSIIPCRIYQES
jgi:hypothetical protein